MQITTQKWKEKAVDGIRGDSLLKAMKETWLSVDAVKHTISKIQSYWG